MDFYGLQISDTLSDKLINQIVKLPNGQETRILLTTKHKAKKFATFTGKNLKYHSTSTLLKCF